MSMKVILKKVTRDLLNKIGLDVVIKRLVKRKFIKKISML